MKDNDFYRVIYKDKFVAQLCLEKKGYIYNIFTNKLDAKANVGDLVDDCFEGDIDYKLVKKNNQKIYTLEDLYIIKKIDNKYIYLLKNHKKKIKKIEKQGDFQELGLVYFDEEECKLIKDEKYTKFFNEFLIGKDKKKLLRKNIFNFDILTISLSHKKVCGLSYLKDIEKTNIVPLSKLMEWSGIGDIYYLIEVGKEKQYIYDEDNLKEGIHTLYLNLFVSSLYADKESSFEDQKAFYLKSLEQLDTLKNTFEKVYLKYKKQIDKIKDSFEEQDIVAEYHLREENISNNDEKYYDTDRIDENEFNEDRDVKIFQHELPKYASEGDNVVLVRNPETGELSYQLSHIFYFDFIDYAIKETHRLLESLEI